VTAVTLPFAAGCATRNVGPKTGVGAAAGAAAGGFLGANTHGGPEGLIGGALIGGLAGGAIGSVLDQQDQAERYHDRGGYGYEDRRHDGPPRHGRKSKHERRQPGRDRDRYDD
jgi:phage tail tape-measure protein